MQKFWVILLQCSWYKLTIKKLRERYLCKISSIKNYCCFVVFDTWSNLSDLQTHPVPVPSSDTKSMTLPLVTFSVSTSPSFLSQKGCISMHSVMSDQLQWSIQAVTHGSRTEGLRKMGDLSANIVCLWTVTVREGHCLCLCEAEPTG